MESTRDLGRIELWQESLERSLARRGKLARASIELNRLRPERDFGDTEFVHESAMYWNLRRRAAAKRSMTPVMGAGGLSALALLAAALPTFFGDSGVSGRVERIAMGVGARSRSLPAVPSASDGTSVTSVPGPATDVAARSVAAPAPAVSRPSTYSPTPTGHPRVATTPPHLATTPPHLATTPPHLTTARVHVTESVVHATGAPVGVRHLLAADDATVASDSVHGRNRTSHPTKASVRPHASGGAAVHVAGPVRAPSHGSATHHATGPANGSASNHAAGRTPAGSRYAATGSGGTGLGIRPTRPKNLAPTRQKTTPPARQKTTAPPAIGSNGYANPLAGASVTPERIDQGVDYAGSGTLSAIGSGRVTYVGTSGTGWPGAFIEYRLVSGPDNGRYVYYAEGVSPAAGLHVGEMVRAGQAIATILPGSSSGIEIGWGAGIGTETYAAEMGQWKPGYDAGNIPTAAGESFSALIASLGGPPGKIEG